MRIAVQHAYPTYLAVWETCMGRVRLKTRVLYFSEWTRSTVCSYQFENCCDKTANANERSKSMAISTCNFFNRRNGAQFYSLITILWTPDVEL